MMRSLGRFSTFCIVFLALLVATESRGAIPKYTIQPIPGRYVSSINNAGQVTGTTQEYEGFVWDSVNGVQYLPRFNGEELWPVSINDSGVITGGSDAHGIVLDGDVLTDIGGVTWPSAINNVNQVTGMTRNGGFPYDAFIWDEFWGLRRIRGLGSWNSKGFAINDYGVVVGRSEVDVPGFQIWPHAFVWEDLNGNHVSDDGETVDIGVLADGGWSEAYATNNSGTVVGVSHIGNDFWNTEAFMWTEADGIVSMGPLNVWWGPGNHGGVGMAINESDQVVFSNHGMDISFYWDTINGMVDIYDLLPENHGWSRICLTDLSDGGEIIGWGQYGGSVSCFVMEPVPEPATPPVADAGGPYTINVGDTLMLDAGGSTDDDNDIVSYMWDLDDDENFETDAGAQAVFDVNYTSLQLLGLIVDHTYDIHVKVTDSEGQSDVADSTLILVPKPAVQVAVDIKPGTCPNPLNVKSSGVLPVAILGTDDYDVTTIDPTSVRLAGVEPLRSSYEDVGRPVSDTNDCNCITEGPDGFLDLTLKFKTQRIVEAIGDVNDGDVRVLTLTGVLFDPMPFETPIEGADCILIRGRHKPINPADINKDGVVNAADFAIFAQNWLQSSIIDE